MLSSVIRILLVLPALTCTTARAEPLRPAAEQVGPPFTTPLRVFDTAAAWLGTLSADGQSLAVAHVDGRVRMWDVASGHRRQVFEGARPGSIDWPSTRRGSRWPSAGTPPCAAGIQRPATCSPPRHCRYRHRPTARAHWCFHRMGASW